MASKIERAARIAVSIGQYWAGSPRAAPPLQVYFLATDRCNLKCRMCQVWTWARDGRARDEMDIDAVSQFFTRCRAAAIPTLVISGGEPLLRKDIDEMLVAAANNFPYVRLQTNGWLLAEHARAVVETGVEELWVSVDGTNGRHDEIRGRNNSFARIEEGIASVGEWKARLGRDRPRLTVHTTVLPGSLDAAVDTVRWAASVGASDVGVYRITDISDDTARRTDALLGDNAKARWGTLQFTSGIGFERSGRPIALDSAHVRELEAVEDKTGTRVHIDPILVKPSHTRPVKRCVLPWTMMMVAPDGDMTACHGIDALRLGSVLDADIEAVWNGDAMRAFRSRARRGFPVCEGCCVPRRTPGDHLRNPENFRRLFVRRDTQPDSEGRR
ncbi:MAG: radical SAM protein [Deltaproteobacteria bacterium]|nr:radical SAM protein [Deltaproteobacteria bacterium]